MAYMNAFMTQVSSFMSLGFQGRVSNSKQLQGTDCCSKFQKAESSAGANTFNETHNLQMMHAYLLHSKYTHITEQHASGKKLFPSENVIAEMKPSKIYIVSSQTASTEKVAHVSVSL